MSTDIGVKVLVLPVSGEPYTARLNRDALTETLGGFPTTIGLEIHTPHGMVVLGFWTKSGDGREGWSDELDMHHQDTTLPLNTRAVEAFFPEGDRPLYGTVVITSYGASGTEEPVIDLTDDALAVIRDELGPVHAPEFFYETQDGSHRRHSLRDIL